jgi:hypothetical protein
VSTTWATSVSRPVGDDMAVPKLATPAMPTAGPMMSLTGAARRLCVYWARSSLSVSGDRLVSRLAASE